MVQAGTKLGLTYCKELTHVHLNGVKTSNCICGAYAETTKWVGYPRRRLKHIYVCRHHKIGRAHV